MHCRNCGHHDSVVLLVDLAVVVAASGPAGPPPTEWSLTAACPAFASADVRADPAALLARLAG